MGSGSKKLDVQAVNRADIHTGEIAGSTERLAAGDDKQALALLVPAATHLSATGTYLPGSFRAENIPVYPDGTEGCYDVLGLSERLELVREDEGERTLEHMTPGADQLV